MFGFFLIPLSVSNLELKFTPPQPRQIISVIHPKWTLLNVSITHMTTRRNWPITVQSMLSNREKKMWLASHFFLPFHWLIEINEYLYEI